GSRLAAATRAVVVAALKGAADPRAVLLAARPPAKRALPQQPELLDAVQALLRRRPSASPAAGEDAKQAFSVNPAAPLVAQVHEALRANLAAENPEQAAQPASVPAQVVAGGAEGQQDFDPRAHGSGAGQQLGQWVMNTQTGGVVAHRVGTLPLLLGGRLVEVDVALFEQDARQSRQGESRSRHLVFVLDTASLGGVEVSARLVDSRLRIRFAAERDATLELLASRREALARQLA